MSVDTFDESSQERSANNLTHIIEAAERISERICGEKQPRKRLATYDFFPQDIALCLPEMMREYIDIFGTPSLSAVSVTIAEDEGSDSANIDIEFELEGGKRIRLPQVGRHPQSIAEVFADSYDEPQRITSSYTHSEIAALLIRLAAWPRIRGDFPEENLRRLDFTDNGFATLLDRFYENNCDAFHLQQALSIDDIGGEIIIEKDSYVINNHLLYKEAEAQGGTGTNGLDHPPHDRTCHER